MNISDDPLPAFLPFCPEAMAAEAMAAVPVMRDEANRKASFVDGVRGIAWPHINSQLTPARMAAAGFYFDPLANSPDRVTCFACKGSLQCWDVKDSPWTDHKTHYAKCPFLLSAAPAQLRPNPSATIYVAKPVNETKEALIAESFKLIEILFQSLDKDNAKVITMKQLNGLISSRDFAHCAAVDLLMTAADRDSNAVLDFQEFLYFAFCCSRNTLLRDMSCFFRHPTNQQLVASALCELGKCLESFGLRGADPLQLSYSQFVQFFESEMSSVFKLSAFEIYTGLVYPAAQRQMPKKLPDFLSGLYAILSWSNSFDLPGKYATKQSSRALLNPASNSSDDEWQGIQNAFIILENDFCTFDMDGNGLVDFDEIRARMPASLPMGEKLRIQARLEHAFQNVDIEKTSQLDFMEFLMMAYYLTSDGPYTDLVHESKDSAVVRTFFVCIWNHFKKADIDKNLRLTLDEVKVFYVSTFGKEVPDLDTIFRRYAAVSQTARGRLAVDMFRFIRILYSIIRRDGPFVPERYNPEKHPPEPIVTSIPIAVCLPTKLGVVDPVVIQKFKQIKILSQKNVENVTRTESFGTYDDVPCKARAIEGFPDKSVLADLRYEVDVWRRLDHPNCEKLHGAHLDPQNGGILILSECGDYCSFFDFYSRKSVHFDYPTCLRIARECASGLGVLHRLGCMHRNVKSMNILLSKEMVAKVTGFNSTTSVSTSTEVKGTIPWMAPEVLSNWFGTPHLYDKTCDIYSYGILLWEIFHCSVPYADVTTDQKEVAESVFKHNRRPIISRNCPEGIVEIIRRAWDRQSRARPSLEKVVDMLDASKDDLPAAFVSNANASAPFSSAMLDTVAAMSISAARPTKKSLRSGPADVWIPWQKPNCDNSKLFLDFVRDAGNEAGEILQQSERRHHPISFDQRPKDPMSVVWEDKWSSSEPSRDPEGEELVARLAVLLRKRKKQFRDPFFPTDASSLFVDPNDINKNIKAASTGRTDQQAFLAGRDVANKIVWKRPSEMLNTADKVKVWSGSISPEDVVQGSLGNCYFMAALAACASENEDILIKDLLIEDYADIGLFGVKFFVMGKWTTVVVDDYFPCEQCNSQWKPIFCCPKKNSLSEANTKEIWPMLFEKAFAKLHGSYECTDSGFSEDALQYLTAGVIEIKKLVDTLADFSWLKSSFFEGSLSHGACSPSSKLHGQRNLSEVGLVSGHAYSVLQALESSSGVKLVQVRNPWGRLEWKGRYSDSSSEWTAELKQEVGFRDEEDGTFFMEWSDFVKYFPTCKKVDPTGFNKLSEDRFARIDGAAGCWVAGKTAGGKSNAATFCFNPAFDMIGDTGEVIVTVYQADVRHTMYWPAEDELYEPYLSVFVYFGEVGTSLREIGDLYGGFDGDRLMTITVRIEKGRRYTLVASAGSPGVEGAFSITACGRNVELFAVPTQAVPPDAALKMAASRKK